MKNDLPAIVTDTDDLLFFALKTVFRYRPTKLMFTDTMQGIAMLMKELPNPVIIITEAFIQQAGTDTITQLQTDYPGCKIIVISESNDCFHLSRLIKQHIHGVVHKTRVTENIIKAMEHDARGNVPYCCPVITQIVIDKEKYNVNDVLTAREIEILKLVVEDTSYKMVADKLCLSPNTIKKHCSNMLEKTRKQGCESLGEYAFKMKLAVWKDNND